MLGGYAGKILDVNLESGELKDIPLDEEVLKMYLGGKGLGLKLIYDEFRGDIQPFDPDNYLFLLQGRLQEQKCLPAGVIISLRVNPL